MLSKPLATRKRRAASVTSSCRGTLSHILCAKFGLEDVYPEFLKGAAPCGREGSRNACRLSGHEAGRYLACIVGNLLFITETASGHYKVRAFLREQGPVWNLPVRLFPATAAAHTYRVFIFLISPVVLVPSLKNVKIK